jgi:hypothetical protein
VEYPNLAWTTYTHGNKKEPRLFFIVGEKADKFVCLDGTKMPESDVNVLRDHVEELQIMDVDMRVTWIRDHLVAWRTLYREVYKDRLVIQEVFKVPERKKK